MTMRKAVFACARQPTCPLKCYELLKRIRRFAPMIRHRMTALGNVRGPSRSRRNTRQKLSGPQKRQFLQAVDDYRPAMSHGDCC